MELARLLDAAFRVVFFLGAGASTEPPSCIPDFRSAQGLWRDRELMAALSRDYFFRDPVHFWELFGRIFLPWAHAQPNAVHRAPGRLAALGKQVTVVTQSIDGLDRLCSTGYPVYELHGSLRGATCPRCGTTSLAESYPADGPPRCACGRVLKPDVVLFGDPLDYDRALRPAREAVDAAELLLVVGTSLTVAPANLLVVERGGTCPMVILNRDPTPYDQLASLVLHESAGPVLDAAIGLLEAPR
ncbi:MAG: Sir2 family NAD-dependent protein deacetylase [Myxococcales bacterium]|jgi:NAD-dependent deacetylase